MSKQEKNQLGPAKLASAGFDYAYLKPIQAEKVRKAATSIREKINQSLRGLIEAGQGLLAVKHLLPHGQFLPWLEAEFGWCDRTARRLMEVAEQFGSKLDIVSDLGITTTALYHLAAPSTPFAARQMAIDRAEAGEKITPAIATEIIMLVRKVAPLQGKPSRPDRLARGLSQILKRFQERFGPDRVLEFVRQLRDYASLLEKNGQAKDVGRR